MTDHFTAHPAFLPCLRRNPCTKNGQAHEGSGSLLFVLFIWSGDILMLYALAGLFLPFFRKMSHLILWGLDLGIPALLATLYWGGLMVSKKTRTLIIK